MNITSGFKTEVATPKRHDMTYHIVNQIKDAPTPSEAADVLVGAIDEFREQISARIKELEMQTQELYNALSKLS